MFEDPEQPIEYTNNPPVRSDDQSDVYFFQSVLPESPPKKNTIDWNYPVAILSWLVILLVTSGLATLAYLASQQSVSNESGKADLLQTNFAVKVELGIRNSTGLKQDGKDSGEGDQESDTEAGRTKNAEGNTNDGNVATNEDEENREKENEQFEDTIDRLNQGPVEQRFCAVALVGEIKGPTAAKELITEIRNAANDEEYEYSETQVRLESILVSLYSAFETGKFDLKSIETGDKEFLIDQLGFSGELALYPAETTLTSDRARLIDSANQVFTISTVGTLIAILVGLASLGAALLAGILYFSGAIRFATPDWSGRGQVYLETFAIWMLAFVAYQFAGGMLSLAGVPMLAIVVGNMLTLVVLFWPLLRGATANEIVGDIGLKLINPVREIFVGLFAYLATIPGLIVGIVTLAIIMNLGQSADQGSSFSTDSTPGHPIIENFALGSWMPILVAVLGAAVIAPIVEEIVFRGLLYRALRDSSAGMRVGLSVLFSCLINSLIFTAIHPQSWVGLFVLMPLAIGFSICREWRNNLIAPITMHALNNGGLTVIMIVMAMV